MLSFGRYGVVLYLCCYYIRNKAKRSNQREIFCLKILNKLDLECKVDSNINKFIIKYKTFKSL